MGRSRETIALAKGATRAIEATATTLSRDLLVAYTGFNIVFSFLAGFESSSGSFHQPLVRQSDRSGVEIHRIFKTAETESSPGRDCSAGSADLIQ
jgi:hypothetical protein